MARLALMITILCIGCSKNLPKDQAHTLDRIRAGVLKVGVVENPPWTSAERRFMERFADHFEAEPQWHLGSESQVANSLMARQLDVAIGGFTVDSPWEKVGKSLVLLEVNFIVADAPKAEWHDRLEGVEVSIEGGTPQIPLLREEGAKINEVKSLSEAPLPLATEDFKAHALGLVRKGPSLEAKKHVLLTAPGENGFLRALDKFIVEERGLLRNGLEAGL